MTDGKPGKVTRRKFLAAGGALAAGPLVLTGSRSAEAAPGPIHALVSVEPEPLHPLPKTQYGHFIEHLGRCIKGGIWAPGEEPDMFLGGVRKELLAAVRSINPSLIRYPGGCFADGYHWQDGIGPRSERPKRRNLAWGHLGPEVGPLEDNQFGTDEFLQFCEAVGAEPMLTANVGSGTAQEAATWVEYVNGSKDSKWGAERVRNGHPEPYRVKHWFIGNEIFGSHEIGHQTPEQYVGTFLDYARTMRKVDPDLKLIPVGNHFPEGSKDQGINKTVLTGVGAEADYLSIHQYAPSGNVSNTIRYMFGKLHKTRLKQVYYAVIGALRHMESCLEKSGREARIYSPPGKQIPVAFDEWNLWFDFVQDIIQTNYNLRDGVWVASMLNMLHRRAPEVAIANIAQMVNCLGIISSDPRGTFLTPSALAFKLYTENAGEVLLPSAVDCPALPHDEELPMLDVSATRTGNRLALFLINRHYNRWSTVHLDLRGMSPAGEAALKQVYHPNPSQYNTHEEPEAVKIIEDKIQLKTADYQGREAFLLDLPPHCFALLELEIKEA